MEQRQGDFNRTLRKKSPLKLCHPTKEGSSAIFSYAVDMIAAEAFLSYLVLNDKKLLHNYTILKQ
jgi:hypothetical protein